MSGWIRLHRKMLKNGHLKMPAPALKVWIYFLLKASPWPAPQKNLDTGELWTGYREMQEVLSEKNKKMSEHTIRKALNLLQQAGYIDLEIKEFYGIKVKICNWAAYQKPDPANSAAPDGDSEHCNIASGGTNPVQENNRKIPGPQTMPPPAVTTVLSTALSAAAETAASAAINPWEATDSGACGGPKNNKNYKNYKNPPRDKLNAVHTLQEAWQQNFKLKFGAWPQFNPRDMKHWQEILQHRPAEEILELMELFFTSEDSWIKSSGYTVGAFRSQINKLLARRGHKPHPYRGNEDYMARLAREYL